MTISTPTPNALPSLRQLYQEAFGDSDALTDLFFSTAYAPERCLCLWDGDRLAAALHWLDCSLKDAKIAMLYAVATAKSCRGRGFCRQLIETTHAHLQAQGYAAALLVPAEPPLFAMYQSFGYLPAAGCRCKVYQSAEPSCDVQPLTASEYFRCRRALLPENSLVQEGIQIPFADAYYRFFGGSGWIAAVSPDCVGEVLGSDASVPGLLAALGLPQATLRAPGCEQPHALWLPFRPKLPVPCYVGFDFA